MAREKGLTFYKRRSDDGFKTLKAVISWIVITFFAVFLAFIVNIFFGNRTKITGSSMEPTLYNGQIVFVDKFLYKVSSPKKGDVIVFYANGNTNSHTYARRVIATPQDTVLIRDGVVYVNGLESKLVSDVIVEPGIAEYELTIQKGTVFCLGDDPLNSEDSRSANIGPVKYEDIVGKVWFKLKAKNSPMGFINKKKSKTEE
ncbi:MAG: signal peptidase I [Lachnospiraceae bacterium]|nr:signal peptidase I [Lachnospiraceae bacterium]